MPNATVYIKPIDLDKWRAIENKSEFIHEALNKEPEEDNSWADELAFVEGQGVVDTTTGEHIESDKEMVDELKRLGKVL